MCPPRERITDDGALFNERSSAVKVTFLLFKKTLNAGDVTADMHLLPAN